MKKYICIASFIAPVGIALLMVNLVHAFPAEIIVFSGIVPAHSCSVDQLTNHQLVTQKDLLPCGHQISVLSINEEPKIDDKALIYEKEVLIVRYK